MGYNSQRKPWATSSVASAIIMGQWTSVHLSLAANITMNQLVCLLGHLLGRVSQEDSSGMKGSI